MEEQLHNFERKFYLLLEKMIKEYPLYKSTGSKEYKNIFLNTENNINKLFKDLFLFKSKLLAETDKVDSELQEQNQKIKSDKGLIEKYKKKITPLRNIYSASEPIKEYSITTFNNTFNDFIIMITILILLLFVFFKL